MVGLPVVIQKQDGGWWHQNVSKMTAEILKKCAVYGAVVAVVGAAFCHHRIQGT